MTAAPKHSNFFLHALGALVLAAALALAWANPVQAAGRTALAPKSLQGGGPGKGHAGDQGNQNGNNNNNQGKGKGKGKDKDKGKDKGNGGSTGGGDNGDTGVAPSPNNPPPNNPAPPPPPPPPSPPLPGDGAPDPSAPPHSPEPAPSPDPSPPDPSSPDPSSPDPSSPDLGSPDPSSPGPGAPDSGPSSPDPSPSSPDTAPSPPPPVAGETNGNGSSGPSVVPPSSPPGSNSNAPSAPAAPSIPTVAALPSFRQVQPGSTGSFSPQNARAHGNNLQTSFARLFFRFKRLLHLWGGNHAGLSLRHDGVAGTIAILVSLVGRAPVFAIYTPHGATTHKAGAKYRLSTWLRSAHPGATLCLRTQELDRRNQLVRTTESCVSAGARWQHLRLNTKALGAKHKLRFSVYQLDAVPGDSFEVGGLTAGRVKR